MEPVFVRRIPAFFQYILKCPEATAYMVEDAVQNDADAGLMQVLTYILEILIGTETCIHLLKISRVVSVGVGFKQRRKIDGVKYKVMGAVKDKADIFLVPAGSNYKEAIKTKKEKKYKIKIIKVKTLDEAISKLKKNG